MGTKSPVQVEKVQFTWKKSSSNGKSPLKWNKFSSSGTSPVEMDVKTSEVYKQTNHLKNC